MTQHPSTRRRLAAGIAAGALGIATLGTALAGSGSAVPPDAGAQPGAEAAPYDVLVFSKTAGFRHGSIPTGIEAVEKLGEENGFSVTATEDASVFNDADLAEYEVVLWLSTTGDVLDEGQQDAFERYIQGGGGYVGIHAASDTEYDWPWYGELVGAYFAGHPAQQDAVVKVRGRGNPANAELPNRWERFDEWYSFDDQPAANVRVLASLDESSYDPGHLAMGKHPISWCHAFDGGRSFYTGMGHTDESFSEPEFLSHVLGGIEQVAGVAKFNCGGE